MPKSRKKAINLGSWNVRGLEQKLKDIEDVLGRKGMDICGLQEIKLDKVDNKMFVSQESLNTRV